LPTSSSLRYAVIVLAILLGLVALLVVAGGVLLGLFAWRNFQAASLLGRPLSRIARLRPDTRKVRGQIVPLDTLLRSPVTDQPCVYYRLRVYEERQEWKSTDEPTGGIIVAGALGGATGGVVYEAAGWSEREERAVRSLLTILDETVSIPLAVRDDTGEVEVDLRGATIMPKQKGRIATGEGRPAPPKLADLLRDEYDFHTVDERGWVKTLHFVEEMLPVGAKVTVVGRVEPLKSGDLCFRKKGGDDLLVSDRDVAKEARSAQGRAMGYAAGAGGALAVALIFLIWATALAARALLTGR
jgi:hypothetical protein